MQVIKQKEVVVRGKKHGGTTKVHGEWGDVLGWLGDDLCRSGENLGRDFCRKSLLCLALPSLYRAERLERKRLQESKLFALLYIGEKNTQLHQQQKRSGKGEIAHINRLLSLSSLKNREEGLARE